MAKRGRRRSRGPGVGGNSVPEDLAALGKRLRELRTRFGLTQADVAGDRYTHAYVSTIEAGRREPSNDALAYFAERLGVGVEELWSGRSVDWALQMSEDLRAQGLTQEAYELLERTLTNLERAGHVPPRVLAVMPRELGLAEQDRDPEVAEKHFRQAVELATQNGTPVVERAGAFAALGDFLRQRGDLEGAVEAHSRASHMLLEQFSERS